VDETSPSVTVDSHADSELFEPPPGTAERPVNEPSDRSRGVMLALNLVLGFFGAHRFYVGKPKTGALMAVTLGGAGLWYLYDLILVVAGEFRDNQGRKIVNWSSGAGELDSGRSRPREDRLAEVEVLRAEVGELAERVDFLERMLARTRERRSLSSGEPD